MTTLATFRTNVAAKIGLDNTVAGDQGLIDGWVNDGYLEVAWRTNAFIASATAAETSGTGDYTLDTNLLKIIEVYVTSSGSKYKLTRTTMDMLISMRISSSANVSPAQYYALGGGNRLMVYPTPAAADVLTFLYVPRPTALSLSSDSPSDLPAEFHKVVEFYALAEAADYDDDQTSAQGERYRQRYEQELVRMKRALTLKGDNRLPRARVNPGRYPIPHDRSTY